MSGESGHAQNNHKRSGYHPTRCKKQVRSAAGGTEVNFVTEGNKVFIVRSRRKNSFLEWLGKGKLRSKEDADLFISQLRGRTDK